LGWLPSELVLSVVERIVIDQGAAATDAVVEMVAQQDAMGAAASSTPFDS